MKKLITIEIEAEEDEDMDGTLRHVCHQINQGYVTGFDNGFPLRYKFEVKFER